MPARLKSALRVRFVTSVGKTRSVAFGSAGRIRFSSARSSGCSGMTSSRFAFPSRMTRTPSSKSTLAHVRRISSLRLSPASAAVRYHARRPRLSATWSRLASSSSVSGRRMYLRSLFSSSFGKSSSWFDSVRPVFRHQFAKARNDSRRVFTLLAARPSFQYDMSTRSTGSSVRSLSRDAPVSVITHSRCICLSRTSFLLTPRSRHCSTYSRMCCASGFLFSSDSRSWRASTTPSLRSATSASSLLAIRSAARRSVVRLDFSLRRPCWSK
jgi:hypothetical protein